jgi:ADP-ribose pyrophosphatase
MSQLFDAYAFCPLCGAGDLTRGVGTLTCGKCGHREFNNPITAVAVYLFDAQDRVLLIRRAKDPAKGKWAPPGGFLDIDETLEHAAAREILEETGLTLSDLSYLGAFPNHYVYAGLSQPVCDVFFTGRVDASKVKLQQEEVVEFRMAALSEIDPAELAFDSMRHALAVLKGRKHDQASQ